MTCPESLAAAVRGFLDPLEGRRLFELAATASKRGPCLEIGSYCGKSAIYLGCGCRENGGVLFSVDHHRGSEEQQPGEEYFDPALFDPVSGCVNTLPAFRQSRGCSGTRAPIACTR